MQTIQLTQEYKSKLLEMCKYFYPTYVDILFTNYGMIRFIEQWEKVNNTKEYKPTIDCYIHWFEFVFIHLVSDLNFKSDFWEDIPPYASNIFGCGKWNLYVKFHFLYPKACKGGCSDRGVYIPPNPIDYLYKEFKKLKQ